MDILVVSGKYGSTRRFHVGWGAFAGLLLVVVLAFAGAFAGGYLVAPGTTGVVEPELADWQAELDRQRELVESSREEARQEIDALTVRLGELQARLLRIDALGEQLARMADLEADEFDFGEVPPLGGPEQELSGDTFREPGFLEALTALSAQIDRREQQLEVISMLMGKQDFQRDVFVTGRPIRKGWISSRYGRRTDPFSGRRAWHSGFDFAGKKGSEIVSVAAGVVTWSESRNGYGLMVEINHGGGYATRYAHNLRNLVKVGDVVRKGQPIALMGSSGRSTGPHVHFEVHRDGKPVNPAHYIHRASK